MTGLLLLFKISRERGLYSNNMGSRSISPESIYRLSELLYRGDANAGAEGDAA